MTVGWYGGETAEWYDIFYTQQSYLKYTHAHPEEQATTTLMHSGPPGNPHNIKYPVPNHRATVVCLLKAPPPADP